MDYPAIVTQVLKRRGIVEEEEINEFFERSYDTYIKDPFEFSDMKSIVNRLVNAISNKETVGVYGDFDQDGVPGLALFIRALRAVGVEHIEWHVPDRRLETHGFHMQGADSLLKKGASLIVVIDCGINDTETIQHVQQNGADVIILDHHTPESDSSSAFAVLNPLCEKQPTTPLCGAGCAWKVAHALFLETGQPKGSEKWLLDFAGIATVADRVPLIKENRILAYCAGIVLQKTKHCGLREICERQRIHRDTNLADICMRFSAYINSATRTGKTNSIVSMLLSDDDEEVKILADICDSAVKENRSLEGKVSRACHKIAKTKQKERDIWVFGDRMWSASLSGLTAQKLADAYNKTVFVWGLNESGKITGSVRTALRHNVLDLMKKTADLYETYGGHIFAAGFSPKSSSLVSLEDHLNDITPVIEEEKQGDVFPVSLKDLTSEVCSLFYDFEPFGTDNQRPCFEIEAPAIQQRRFGKKNSHLSYTISEGDLRMDVVSYSAKEDVPLDTHLSIRGYIEKDVYNNRYCLRELSRSIL